LYSLSYPPSLFLTPHPSIFPNSHAPSYKVGDAFISLPQPEVLALLTSSTERIDEEVQALKDSVEGIHEEMEGLKKALYGRFGRSINLET
jgi:chaperonin cofactor prefoldin